MLYMCYKLYHIYNIAIYLEIRNQFIRVLFDYINENSKHIMVPQNFAIVILLYYKFIPDKTVLIAFSPYCLRLSISRMMFNELSQIILNTLILSRILTQDHSLDGHFLMVYATNINQAEIVTLSSINSYIFETM